VSWRSTHRELVARVAHVWAEGDHGGHAPECGRRADCGGTTRGGQPSRRSGGTWLPVEPECSPQREHEPTKPRCRLVPVLQAASEVVGRPRLRRAHSDRREGYGAAIARGGQGRPESRPYSLPGLPAEAS